MRILHQRSVIIGIASTVAVGAPGVTQGLSTPSSRDARPPASSQIGKKRVYAPGDFMRFAPRTALDMLSQVPGFTIRGEDTSARGLGLASGNVLLNGKRLTGKSTDPTTALQAIPAANVVRIEIVDAAEAEVPGLSGETANVIYEARKKISGQFNFRPEFRPHYVDPLYTRGAVSVSGSSGSVQYTLGLKNDSSRGGAGGPTLITREDGSLFEDREDIIRTSFDQPQLSGQFRWDGPGTSVGNLNLLGRHFDNKAVEGSRRDRVVGPDVERTFTQREKGFNYELGGDFEFALFGGRFKAIGLSRSSDRPLETETLATFSDMSPAVGSRYVQVGQSSENIARGEYRWKFNRSDFQLSSEAAFNTLDIQSRLFSLSPTGQLVEQPFPSGSGKVSEDRYETLLTVNRPLSDSISMQLIGGGEWSTIKQIGRGGKQRSFFRPKGSLTLSAKVTPTLNVNFKLLRRVGQLDFGQFLARVFLDDGNANAGNPNLMPTQQWIIDLEIAKDLGRYGKTKVNFATTFYEDYLDIIPIGTSGESIGNIDRARSSVVEWNSTFELDPLKIAGAKINIRAFVQVSNIRDPLTGKKRPLSNFTDRLIEASYRHDIPKSDWAYGVNASYSHKTLGYRLNEVGRQFEGPVGFGVFVEDKDVHGLTVRASASNLLNARSRWDRTVYTGRRNAAPVDFVEKRNRLIGPIFAVSVRGAF